MRPLPVPDRDSAPWWAALARHELVVQECGACGHLRWPPRAICNRCGGFEWTWRETAARGTVVAWIVNHHPFGDAYPTPYTVVTARLAEQDDIMIPGGYDGPADGVGLAVGLAVHATYEDVSPEVTLLRWRLA